MNVLCVESSFACLVLLTANLEWKISMQVEIRVWSATKQFENKMTPLTHYQNFKKESLWFKYVNKKEKKKLKKENRQGLWWMAGSC